MGLLEFGLLSGTSVCQSTAKGQILSSSSRFPPRHEGEGGDIIVSPLIFTFLWSSGITLVLCPGWVTLPDLYEGTWHHLFWLLAAFFATLAQKSGPSSSSTAGQAGAVGIPKCTRVHSPDPQSAPDLAGDGNHHQAGLVNFIWRDTDALQTPRDTFASTQWGFSYRSAININGTQAAKSTWAAVKMYPWGPNSQRQKEHKPFLPPGLLLPWSMKRAKQSLWLIKPFHSTGEQLGNGWCSPVPAWGSRAACCGQRSSRIWILFWDFFFPRKKTY